MGSGGRIGWTEAFADSPFNSLEGMESGMANLEGLAACPPEILGRNKRTAGP